MNKTTFSQNNIDLQAFDLEVEEMDTGVSLASVSTAGTGSTASCPATSASSFSSASSYT